MTQAIPKTADELLARTTDAWTAFTDYVDALPAATLTGPSDAAGWTIKDHVSHVTQWDVATLALMNDGVPMHETLRFSYEDHKAGNYFPINEIIRALRINANWDEVRAERDQVYADIVGLLSRLTPEQLAAPGAEAGIGSKTEPLAAVMVGYLEEHYLEHLGYIKKIAEG